MNPPFGTRNAGIDTAFVMKGMENASVVYSLHKTSTRDVSYFWLLFVYYSDYYYYYYYFLYYFHYIIIIIIIFTLPQPTSSFSLQSIECAIHFRYNQLNVLSLFPSWLSPVRLNSCNIVLRSAIQCQSLDRN